MLVSPFVSSPHSPPQRGTRADEAVNSLILADITSLQWRGFVNGAINLPYVINAFVGADITQRINGYSDNGWRWGVRLDPSLTPRSDE
jgi:hypothetical protein